MGIDLKASNIVITHTLIEQLRSAAVVKFKTIRYCLIGRYCPSTFAVE